MKEDADVAALLASFKLKIKEMRVKEMRVLKVGGVVENLCMSRIF